MEFRAQDADLVYRNRIMTMFLPGTVTGATQCDLQD